jgi:hypothetical protein
MKKVPYFHILLFVITFFTTLSAGALQKGINIFESPQRLLDGFTLLQLCPILFLHHLL